jgi:hypothetical protein
MTTLDTPPKAPAACSAELRHASRAEWIELTARFRDHNYRQCWDYAALMGERAGAAVEYVAVVQGGAPVGLASTRIKRVPGLGTGVAYVAGGPLVRIDGDGDPATRLEVALAALAREYCERRGMVLRVFPTIGDGEWNVAQAQRFRAAGFSPAVDQPGYRTMLVDVERPLAEVRSSLAQKWRNCLNKADRAQIRVVEGGDPALFEQFFPLFDELIARKAFDVTLGADFYARLQSLLPEGERLHVAIAWVDDQPAAGVVASIHGDTGVYLLGAANDIGRKVNAAYLLQWKVIEAVSAAGCRFYDLGGVDAEANPGVYKFKLGFGGEELAAAGPYELSPGRFRGAAVRNAEKAFRRLSALRAR